MGISILPVTSVSRFVVFVCKKHFSGRSKAFGTTGRCGGGSKPCLCNRMGQSLQGLAITTTRFLLQYVGIITITVDFGSDREIRRHQLCYVLRLKLLLSWQNGYIATHIFMLYTSDAFAMLSCNNCNSSLYHNGYQTYRVTIVYIMAMAKLKCCVEYLP